MFHHSCREATMTEKEMLLGSWEREYQTTSKVFKAYPEGRLDFKPHELSRTARELAWTIISEEQIFVNGAISGKFDFGHSDPPPSTMKDIVSAYEKKHAENVGKVKGMSDADLNKTVKVLVARGTLADVRSIDTIWGAIMDNIHHRGQFSIYLRMAGGKVPAIYGPSHDEPWD
jgi:uncharacterized damage-inducible protein DinB